MRIGLVEFILILFIASVTVGPQVALFVVGWLRRANRASALAARPKLLLLDEPAAGMNPTETRELMETIRQIREMFGVSILLIEHDMSLVMGVCERIYVLDYGTLIADGTPDQIRSNEKVIKAYLGG